MDTKMKKLLKRIVKDTNAEKIDTLQAKTKFQQQIINASENGLMAVLLHIYWMVDNVSSSQVSTIPATLVHYNHLFNKLGDEASVRGVELLKPSQAYENGHPHAVYI